MKKFLLIILTAVICFSLTACRKGSPAGSNYSDKFDALNSTEFIEKSSAPETQNEKNEFSEDYNNTNSETNPTQSNGTNTAAQCQHQYKIESQTATCDKDGYTTKICTLCGYKNKELQKATGHNFAGARCANCGLADVTTARNMAVSWFNNANRVDGYYLLPSDSNYKFSASQGGNLFFEYENDNEFISVSVYGFEKNKCYLTYTYNDGIPKTVEREFYIDSFHSKYKNYFNDMNGDTELSEQIRGKIDGFMLKFENELLKPQINITLKDIGFTEY